MITLYMINPPFGVSQLLIKSEKEHRRDSAGALFLSSYWAAGSLTIKTNTVSMI